MIGPLARPLAQPIANSLLAGAGGGSSASLDIRASVGTSTSPATPTTKAVTGVGFPPKCVLPFGLSQLSDGTGAPANISLGCGLSTSSRAAIGVWSDNAVTTSATYRRHTASKIYSIPNGGASVFAEADLASLDAAGFTLDWSTISGSRILNHICLGGADLEVSLVQCQMNGTNAAQSFAHGLSGAPTGVLFFASVNNSAPANTASVLAASIGAWAGANQFGALVHSNNAVTTTHTRRALYTTASLLWWNSINTIARSMAVSTVDATNVNVTYPVGDGYQSYFWMLCIRGAKCQVGTFDCNASTSPLTITTTGITPKLFLPVFVWGGISYLGTVQNHLMLTIGASDGTNNASCGITDANGVTTTNARRYQSSTTLCEYYRNGAKGFEATAVFSGQSVVVTPTQADFQYGQGGYLILGS